MNRFILIAFFFTFLISSEVVITALAADAFGICMADAAADGESEKDSKEKSEKDSKIEILLGGESEDDQLLVNALIFLEKSIFSKPYLDRATPPPKA